MKNLFLSILLSFGVGLAMMGSPAQVCGDDNAQGHGYTVRNTMCVEMKKLPLPSCIEQEMKVKKIEQRMKTSVPMQPVKPVNPFELKTTRLIVSTSKKRKIGSDPVPVPISPPAHTNSEPCILLDK